MRNYQEILDTWFATEGAKNWLSPSSSFVEKVAKNFSEQSEAAIRGELDDWKQSADSALALVLLLEQVPRALYPDQLKAFAGEERAISVVIDGTKEQFQHQLPSAHHCYFFLSPLKNAENLQLQQFSVLHHRQLKTSSAPEYADFAEHALQQAIENLKLIQKFGRFPERNRALNREPTEEELEYVQKLIESSTH